MSGANEASTASATSEGISSNGGDTISTCNGNGSDYDNTMQVLVL